ncbi:helix-turn-helix domain-containing protein [Amycolatopsis sp. NPDC004079]|uniref:helix-turn-helix domain-containing protein n=1 Tax=Amycolatopsis sp. NPDC004079 TaxID=3154549 RepID=UPI0033A3048B
MESDVWDVARPGRAGPLSLGGFRHRTGGTVDLRVVPHPAITVVLEFGDGKLLVDDGAQHGSFVAGLAPRGVRLRGESLECVEVRLPPLAAAGVGAGPAELDRTVGLTELWGRDAARLRDQLSEAGSWDARFALVEAAFARRLSVVPATDPEVSLAWRRIVRSRGLVRVESLAAECGWSRRRLWDRFRAQVGLPPKRAAKLVRFDHAARRLATGASAADVAAECGYTDQSHLHRDVVAFAGVTPGRLAADAGFAADRSAFA